MNRSTKLRYLLTCSACVAASAITTHGLLTQFRPTAETQPYVPLEIEAQYVRNEKMASSERTVMFESLEVLQVPIVAEPKRNWTMEEVDQLIDAGYFSSEDFTYLTAVGRECYAKYDGFYAVASCVLNRIRLNKKFDTIKQVVTCSGQFQGYREPGTREYYKYCTQEVIDASVNILLTRDSTVGDCYYFFGRVDGYDMWADSSVDEFYVVDGNVFYKMKAYDHVHNQTSVRSANSILIWDSSSGSWNYGSGSHYQR